MATYNMVKQLDGTFDEVKAALTDALSAQGFGVLTEIDVLATLQKKLGEEIERYEILGACNPELAHTALEEDRAIGLLLPCNVVVREFEGRTEVSILDPEAMFSVVGEQRGGALGDLPSEAKSRLQRVLASL